MKQLVAYIWKLPLCAVAHTLGVTLGGSVALALGVAMPAIPPEAEPGGLVLAAAVASLTLGLGLAPLATGLGSSFALRAESSPGSDSFVSEPTPRSRSRSTRRSAERAESS